MAKWHYIKKDVLWDGKTYYRYERDVFKKILKEGSHKDYDECDFLMDTGYTYTSPDGKYVWVPTLETLDKEATETLEHLLETI